MVLCELSFLHASHGEYRLPTGFIELWAAELVESLLKVVDFHFFIFKRAEFVKDAFYITI